MAKLKKLKVPVLIVLLVLWALGVLFITPMEAKITLLLAGSLVFSLAAMFYSINKVVERQVGDRMKSKISPMLMLALLLGSIWSLRLAVGLFGLIHPELSAIAADSSLASLTAGEEFFNSLIHTLQTFSMDEDYTAYMISGKAMVHELYGVNEDGQSCFGIYVSILNLLAPIAGGAIILDIIVSFVPKLRLAIYRLAFWKDKYYFSELNEGSLALAKNYMYIDKGQLRKRLLKIPAFGNFIVNMVVIGKSFLLPTIIFTDIDDSDDEKEAEMLAEARLLGALCIKDDLSHVKVNEWGRKKFFLIDEEEEENLKAFTALTDPTNELIRKSEIFLFVNSDAYVQIERNVRNKLIDVWGLVDYDKIREEEEQKKKAEGKDTEENKSDFEKAIEKLKKKIKEWKEEKTSYKQLPTVYPVRCYRNLVSNLLCDVPLYEPLIGKKRNSEGIVDLTVTILGSGDIGTEMFLATYWMGQILNCHLKINVVSMESEEEFWNKIDYVNPEIRCTTDKFDPILRINQKGDMAEVYCDVKYYQCDIKSSKFINYLDYLHQTEGKKDNNIINTDYFFVCLGSDEDNISVANTIKSYIGQYHLSPEYVKEHDERKKRAGDHPSPDTIIAYVVYDDTLTESLNATYQKVNEEDLKGRLKKKMEDEQEEKPLKKMDLIKRLIKTLFDELIEPKKDDEDSKQNKSDGSTKDIYMRAVGSLGEVYSVNNVEMSNYKLLLREVHEDYLTRKNDDFVTSNETRAKKPKEEYNYWASLARVLHRKYKMYSMGMIDFSITDSDYDKKIANVVQEYEEFAHKEKKGDVKRKLDESAWLEHRRWNAFTRTIGYRHADNLSAYIVNTNDHKQMELKLHPCLVECDKNGKRKLFMKDDKNQDIPNPVEHNNWALGELDMLDKLVYDIYHVKDNKHRAKEFKKYDYPAHDKTLKQIEEEQKNV